MLGTTMVLASSLPSPSSSADVTPTRSLSKSAVVDRAVIVGGGLGGLSAALQLRRAGIDAQVYEKRPMISGGEGTLISIFPNGCRALNEANPEIVEKMRRAGTLNMPSKIVYPDGTKIGEWNLSTQMEEKFGQPLIAILWKDALRILSETLPDSCQHTGYDCIGITEWIMQNQIYGQHDYPLCINERMGCMYKVLEEYLLEQTYMKYTNRCIWVLERMNTKYKDEMQLGNNAYLGEIHNIWKLLLIVK